jgi:hypothetical protein
MSVSGAGGPGGVDWGPMQASQLPPSTMKRLEYTKEMMALAEPGETNRLARLDSIADKIRNDPDLTPADRGRLLDDTYNRVKHIIEAGGLAPPGPKVPP